MVGQSSAEAGGETFCVYVLYRDRWMDAAHCRDFREADRAAEAAFRRSGFPTKVCNLDNDIVTTFGHCDDWNCFNHSDTHCGSA